MINWNRYDNFSKGYLSKHHDVVLMDIFHKIKSLILFPPDPLGVDPPHSVDLRKQVLLSLNLRALNNATSQGKGPDELDAINSIMHIPEAAYFKENWPTAYPIWLIDQEIQKRITNNHFTIIHQLVWMLIRLGKTYQVSAFNEPRASIKEALEVILGDTPLKSERVTSGASIGGEKAYRKHFNDFKSVCHFIAAFEHLKHEGSIHSAFLFSLETPSQIEMFLKLSCWFRQALLSLKTPNIKNNALLSGDTLVSLPSWVEANDVIISIEPLPDVAGKIEELISKATRIGNI